MDATPVDQVRVLRLQRNLFAGAAAVVVLTAFGVSLPNAIARRKQLAEANARLLDFQGNIVAQQNAIRSFQAEILKLQAEITAVQQQGRP